MRETGYFIDNDTEDRQTHSISSVGLRLKASGSGRESEQLLRKEKGD